jgi:hypothetical protein
MSRRHFPVGRVTGMAYAPPARATERVKTSMLMRSIFDAMPDAVVLSDDAGRIMLVNEAAAALFGYEREDMPSMSVHDLIVERFRRVHQMLFAATTANPSISAGRWIGLLGCRADGTELPIESSVTFASSAAGSIAIEVVRAGDRATDRQETIARERQRIGHDVSDVVISRLLSAGLMLESTNQLVQDGAVSSRIRNVTRQIDEALLALRGSVFPAISGGADTTTDRAPES